VSHGGTKNRRRESTLGGKKRKLRKKRSTGERKDVVAEEEEEKKATRRKGILYAGKKGINRGRALGEKNPQTQGQRKKTPKEKSRGRDKLNTSKKRKSIRIFACLQRGEGKAVSHQRLCKGCKGGTARENCEKIYHNMILAWGKESQRGVLGGEGDQAYLSGKNLWKNIHAEKCELGHERESPAKIVSGKDETNHKETLRGDLRKRSIAERKNNPGEEFTLKEGEKCAGFFRDGART